MTQLLNSVIDMYDLDSMVILTRQGQAQARVSIFLQLEEAV